MARLTRNSYKRKIILFGVFVFVSIALISTGFAAWVMSSDDEEQNAGNVEVGVVSDSSVNVTITNADDIANFEFRFEPNTASADDLIHAGEENGVVKTEKLELVIKGNVTGSLNDVNIIMIIPSGVQEAINEEYINAPVFTFYKTEDDCNNGVNGTLINTPSSVPEYENTYTFKDLVESNNGNFVITATFSWGTKFNGENPCDTYNDDYETANNAYKAAKTKYETTQNADDYDDMITKLNELNEIKADAQAALANLKLLRAHIYGYFDDITVGTNIDELAALHTEAPKYLITITALAN